MQSLSTVLAAVVALAFLNAALQVALIFGWIRLQKPERPLLRPVTLCAAAANLRYLLAEFVKGKSRGGQANPAATRNEVRRYV